MSMKKILLAILLVVCLVSTLFAEFTKEDIEPLLGKKVGIYCGYTREATYGKLIEVTKKLIKVELERAVEDKYKIFKIILIRDIESIYYYEELNKGE